MLEIPKGTRNSLYKYFVNKKFKFYLYTVDKGEINLINELQSFDHDPIKLGFEMLDYYVNGYLIKLKDIPIVECKVKSRLLNRVTFVINCPSRKFQLTFKEVDRV